MGPVWLKPEQALGSGGRQELGGALRWGKTFKMRIWKHNEVLGGGRHGVWGAQLGGRSLGRD